MAAHRPDPAVPQPPALATGAGGVLTGNQLRAMLLWLEVFWSRGRCPGPDAWAKARREIMERVR